MGMDGIVDGTQCEDMRYMSLSCECLCEKCEYLRTDDTSTLPDTSDLREIDLPVVFERTFLDKRESLCVREEHTEIECMFHMCPHSLEGDEDRMIELISLS